MPKRESVLKSVKKNDPLVLNCEWEACNVTFKEMKPFMDHVCDHLQLLLNYMNGENAEELSHQPDSEKQYACYWNECNHDPFTDFMSLTRHVYFHAFHMKIKSIGMTLIGKNNIQGCMFDSSTRNTIPDIPERFSCGWSHCLAVYDNPELFYLHINNHCDVYPSGNHVPGGCRCQWEGCETVVKSKHKLKDHVRAHTQEKLAACPTCGALFSNMTRLYDHLKRQLESEGESYQCSHCNKRYATERLLKEHMRHHVSHFQCPLCDMTCPNLVNLRLHFQYRHSEARPYQCDQCSHAAKSQNDLRRHQETHKPWIHCDLDDCTFRCHSVNELKRHNKLKHEYTEGVGQHRFQCHLCNACYNFGTKLTDHLRKKHKFRWPPGHVRFRYKFHSDGYYRLQTVRYESIELTQQILASDITGAVNIQPVTASNPPPAGVNQCVSTEAAQPADVYDDVIIKDSEAAKENTVMYSYNLDLLGDVALKDSAMSQSEADSHSAVGESASAMLNNTENKRKRNTQRTKRKRALVLSEDDVKSSSDVDRKCARLDSSLSEKQLEPQLHSTPIKDVSQVLGDSLNYKPVTEQTINLPDGQQIIVTSDVPVDISVAPQPVLDEKAVNIEQTQAQFEGIVPIESVTDSQAALEVCHVPASASQCSSDDVAPVLTADVTDYSSVLVDASASEQFKSVEAYQQEHSQDDKCDDGDGDHHNHGADSSTEFDPEISKQLNVALSQMDQISHLH